jgi:sugar phosphate isomerase/epimerase
MFDLNRRTFLRTATTTGLAAAGLCGMARCACAAGQELKRKFKMGLSCGPIGVRADQHQAIQLARQFHFEAVDPSVGFLTGLSEAELQELLADLKAKNLVWGAAGLPVNFRRDEPTFQAGMKQWVELAKGLRPAGVTRVVTWLAPSHRSLTYLANFRQHARRLREVAKVSADQGQRLGLEYVGPKTSWAGSGYPFIHTMAEMKDLIAEIDQPNVGFLLDSWHWYHARETQEDLLTLSNRDVVACHLNDAPEDVPMDQQRDGRRELPCATGVIDLKGFLGGLVKIGYDGPICAEPFYPPLRSMPPEKALAATAAAMKKAFALVE